MPSLTSYQWQPGNIYGGIAEPEYNAITYTWGRWRLRDENPHERPDITVIPIVGTTWPIPRVDPSHFTAVQLEQVLRKAAVLQPADHLYGRRKKPVAFVWLDVACIDQQASEPRSAAEIGRQAAIFKGAQTVCVWLTTQDMQSLRRGIESMSTFAASTSTKLSEDARAIDHVISFLADPWFSSLWTLQEAFLRHDAFILDRDGELLEYPASTEVPGEPSLIDIFDYGERWCAVCTERAANHSLRSDMYSKAKETIEKRGLKALASMNAMSTYAAALQRTTTFPEDRIYGIQQIFEFRLGKSALNVQSGCSFTVAELEDQLGEALMTKYPVLSQFHVFTEHVPREKRWRVNACSAIPSDVSRQGHSVWESSEDDQPCCSFSVDSTAQGSKRVWWHGKLASLQSLLDACRRVANERLFSELSRNKDMFMIVPDVVDELIGSPGFQASGYRLIPPGPGQEQLSKWLLGHFGAAKLQVLLLGPSSGERYAYMLGMLMLDCGNGEWTRLGLCQWEVSDLQVSDMVSLQYDYLTGGGFGWETSAGLFGRIA